MIDINKKIEICSLYNKNLSIKTIAKKIHCSERTISKVLKNNNISLRDHSSYFNKYINLNTQELINYYNSGLTLQQISKLTKIKINKVYRAIRNNCTMKSIYFYHKNFQKFEIDENFFEKIDTNEKAYVLGFLYADGNCNKKYHQITLKLQERDKLILNKISKLISTNKPLLFSPKTSESHQNQYILKICNKKMYYDLINHGVLPNKTFILSFPIIEKKMYSHFIRGYFDGDGSISKGDWSIISSTLFCKQIQNILFEILNINSQISHDKRTSIGIDKLRVRKKNDLKKIFDWIYKNSTIHLERKFEKFKEVI